MTYKKNQYDSIDLLILSTLGTPGRLVSTQYLRSVCAPHQECTIQYDLGRLVAIGLVEQVLGQTRVIGYRVTQDGVNAKRRLMRIVKLGKAC